METIELNTTQNVSLEFPVASVADRILACLLDFVVIGLYALIMAVVLLNWLQVSATWIMIFFIFPIPFYHLFFELFFNGQSPGKRILNIRVFRSDGGQLTLASCFIRWIFRMPDITVTSGALGTITIILNGKGQRLGDIAAGTTVLKTTKKQGIQKTVWMDVDDNYQPRFPEAERLSDKDVQIIKEVLQATNSSHDRPDTSVQLLSNTRKAIERKTNTQSKLTDTDYLAVMIKDYNACHRENIT